MDEANHSNGRVGLLPPATRHPPPADRVLIRRLTIGLLGIFAFAAAYSQLDLLYSHKFFDVTGRAQWIWPQHQLSREIPVAFFATRNFDLPPNRLFTRIKVFGDPEYTLYFNGTQIGGRRVGEESALDVYDVSQLARTHGNRMVISARSPNGVGGIIASVDVTQEYQNLVPTGSEWSIVRRWRDDLLVRDPPPSWFSRPMLIGRPPVGRWNFLSRRPGVLTPPGQRIVAPRASFSFKTAIPEIDVKGGVAVVVSRPIGATAYDFGPISGRARLTINYDNGVSRAVKVRLANDRSELTTVEGPVEPFVFAAGERTIVDPQERQFRYVMVYGSQVSVSVVQ
jgi:hypothetical protein